MTSQRESSTSYNPFEDAIMKFRADEYLQAREIAQAHAIAKGDIPRTPLEEIERLENMVVAVQRRLDRNYDFLIGIIEERTLVLSSVDEMYDDYC